MFTRIDHVEIVPSDVERSMEFYTRVIGFDLRETIEVNEGPVVKVMFLTLGDTMLEILDIREPEPRSKAPFTVGYIAMALEVESMRGALEYLANQDVEPVWGPVDLGGSVRAEIRDPDGLTIELREWTDEQARP
jgi:catechol 2,3-dioxygenase-like lactoylglutathione lyase family enzyme